MNENCFAASFLASEDQHSYLIDESVTKL